MNKSALLLSFILLLFANSINAQQCGMDHYMEKHLKQHPNALQEDISNISNVDVEQMLNRRDKIIIPIVFHVLHQNGVENISDAQIYNAIQLLNEDFSLSNADFANTRNTSNAPFKNLGANFDIEFRLARVDPNGNCTNGINRIETPLTNEARNNVKELIRWPVNKYMNIWVVKTIENSGGGGIILGFANFPWMSQSTDGIVIRADYVGNIGTASGNNYKGRTLTHEMGHCLNLYHTFQGGCTQQGGGDAVADTPPVSTGGINSNCPTNGNSCPTQSPNLLDMWENYMDYSRGSCQTLFTTGQKSRTYAALDFYQHRKNLYQQQNLVETGVIANPSSMPQAFFRSDKRIVCAGEPVTFNEMQCLGSIETRTWNFQGADILSTSQPNPTVTYTQPGKYKVSLTVNNSFGSDTKEEEDYIIVKPAVSDITTIVESFEDNQWSNADWELKNQFGWEFKLADAGHFGTKSMVADCQNSPSGSIYTLTLPSINLTVTKDLNPRLSFMLGYVRKSTNNNESLRILISSDCGNTFNQVYFRTGSQLVSQANNNKFISNFVPQVTADWIRIQQSLWDYFTSTSVIIKIEVISDNGNPVYIDDINISQFYTGVQDVESFTDLNISPNPSNDIFNISFNSNVITAQTQVYVTDISGRKVAELFPERSNNNVTHMIFNPNTFQLSSGVYYLMLKTDKGILSKKLVFVK